MWQTLSTEERIQVIDKLFKHGETVAVFEVFTKGGTAAPVPLEIVQDNGEVNMEKLVHIVDKAAAIQQLKEEPLSYKFPGTYLKLAFVQQPVFVPTSDNATEAQKAYTVYMVQDPAQPQNPKTLRGKKIKMSTDEPPVVELVMEMVPHTAMDPANMAVIRAKKMGKGGTGKGKGKGKGKGRSTGATTPPPQQRPTTPTRQRDEPQQQSPGSKRGAEAQEEGETEAEAEAKKQRIGTLDIELSTPIQSTMGARLAELSAQAMATTATQAAQYQAAKESNACLTPVAGISTLQKAGRRQEITRRRSDTPTSMEEDADGTA